jgi:hypothetical protein
MKRKPKSALENQIFWVYALIAFSESSNKKACYIGQTVNLLRRLKEHNKNKRVGKSSYYLHLWAAEEETVVKCIILSKIKGNQQKASVLENYWFELAKQDGFETPNSDAWASSKNAENYFGEYKTWPEAKINSRSLDLVYVVEQEIPVNSIYD